jgi:hypothetical protein
MLSQCQRPSSYGSLRIDIRSWRDQPSKRRNQVLTVWPLHTARYSLHWPRHQQPQSYTAPQAQLRGHFIDSFEFKSMDARLQLIESSLQRLIKVKMPPDSRSGLQLPHAAAQRTS